MNFPRISTKQIIIALVAISAIFSVFHIFAPFQSIRPTRWKNIFFALNLRNNEDLIPGMSLRFDELFDQLENSSQINFYFSIFSNNNNDRTDDLILEYFKPLLEKRKIPNTIITDGKTCGGYSKPPSHMNRIDWLACVRNSAIEPLYEKQIFSSRNLNETLVLFFNDIVFSPSDIVNLINTNNGEFDLACGLDFYYNFYDIWVTRGIDGKYFSAFPPFAMDFKSALQIMKSVSPIVGSATDGVPVKCCWNGVAAIKASNFFDKKIRFRSEISEKCNSMQSECKLFCEDLGGRNIVLNPNVIVAYSENFFYLNKLIRNFFIYLIFFLFRLFEFRYFVDETSEMQCEGETKTSFMSMFWVVFVSISILGLIVFKILRKNK